MKKIFYSLNLARMALMLSLPTQAGSVYNIASEEEWNYLTAWHQSWNGDLLGNDDIIRLAADINATYTEGEISGSVSTHGTMTIDLNGHTIRIKGAASAMASIIYLFEGSTLNIMDSRQGGQMIFDDIDGGGESCLFYMHENTTLNIYGGTLLTTYHNNFSSRCYTVNIPSTTNTSTINIYGGQLSGINQNINNNSKNIRVNLYGGIIGSQDNITYERPALYHNPCIGIIKAGKIYGLYGYAALADYIQGTTHQECALAENTEVYIDGVLTPKSQLLSNSDDYKNNVIEVKYNSGLTLDNVEVTSDNCDDILPWEEFKASFDFATNTLRLKTLAPSNQNVLNNIHFNNFDLRIVVEGNWRINGSIVGTNGDLTITSNHFALTEEDGDALVMKPGDNTAITLNGHRLTLTNRVRLLCYNNEIGNTAQSAVKCHDMWVNNSWFDAWGKKPIVDCTYGSVVNATITVGSFRNNDVIQIKPNIRQYVVWTDVYDNQAGSATGDGLINEGLEHTVSATPNSGYHFLRWSNGVTDNPYTFVVTQDTVLYALFEADEVIHYYNVTVASADENMGYVSGGGTHIEQGQSVSISASAYSGYQFMYWMDGRNQVVAGQASMNLTVTEDMDLTAHFRVQPSADSYNLWVCGTQVTASNSNDILGDGVWFYDHENRVLTAMNHGTYNLSNEEFIYDMVTSAPLTVVLNYNIDVTCTTTDNTTRYAIVSHKGLTFTGSAFHGLNLNVRDMHAGNMSQNLTITGHIDFTVFLSNTTSWGQSNIDKAFIFSQKLIVDGAAVEIHTSESTYKVSNKTNSNLQLTNATIDDGAMDARFIYISDASPKYEVNYLTPSLESLCAVGGFNQYFEGTYVTLRAWPQTGYKFVSWSDGNTDNPRNMVMPAENVYLDPIVEIDESLAPKGAVINANATEGMGSIVNFTSRWYAEGTELTITAEAAEGYEFAYWSNGERSNPYLLTVEDGKNINITAIFVEEGVDPWEGVEEVLNQQSKINNQKLIMDGQLFILRNGRIYDAHGAVVK